MAYQHMINYPHAYYLKYFLNKQINVVVWNYRGYGRTKGDPSPEACQRDAEQIIHFVKKKLGMRGKIGVYGRSVGCTAACFLQDRVDMIIADRGFCDLYTLAEKKFFGDMARMFFKFGSQGWQANNSYNYLQKGEKKCYKVIMQDKADEIINLQASLLFGVAREICHA